MEAFACEGTPDGTHKPCGAVILVPATLDFNFTCPTSGKSADMLCLGAIATPKKLITEAAKP
jgi:hypothetical protein